MLNVYLFDRVQNQMSSVELFQLARAPRPFSRSQVMRFWTIRYFSATDWIADDDRQSPHMYSEPSGFSVFTTAGSQVSIHSEYSSCVRSLNTFPLKDLVRLYGGSMNTRSAKFEGSQSKISYKSWLTTRFSNCST